MNTLGGTETGTQRVVFSSSNLPSNEILGALPFPVVCLRLDYSIFCLNDAFTRLSGYAPASCAEQNFLALVHPEDFALAFQKLAEGVRSPQVFQVRLRIKGLVSQSVEIEARPMDGSKNLLLLFTPVVPACGSVAAPCAHEAVVRKQQLELQRQESELRQYFHLTSHDLKEPLRMVASYVRLLEQNYRGLLGADADTFIQFAVDGANRMHAMLDALVCYFQVGKKPPGKTRFLLNQVLGEILEELEGAIKACGAAVSVEGFPEVEGDVAEIKTLFKHLLTNALKFRNGEPPRIHVGQRLEAGRIIFYVRDNGIGVEEPFRERIFGLFQRLHPHGRYPGVGAGLSISRKIVERHGGKIWWEANPQGGSVFCFTIATESS